MRDFDCIPSANCHECLHVGLVSCRSESTSDMIPPRATTIHFTNLWQIGVARNCTLTPLTIGRNRRFLPALKAPAEFSPGQRPGNRDRSLVVRPEGAQAPSSLTERTIFAASIPGAMPRADHLRAIGANFWKHA